MCLAFFSHKPEGVEKEKYQFNNLYALFAPFSATSVKVFLSYTNALGLSEREGEKTEFVKLCMRVDPGKSSEPNWQWGWRTWTSLCYELYSATWLPNFQELVCSNQWLSEDAYLGISSEYVKNSLVILKYLISLFQSSCYLEQTSLLRSYNLKSILTVMMCNKEYFVCLWQRTAPVNRSCLLVEIQPCEMMLCICTDKLSGIAGRMFFICPK